MPAKIEYTIGERKNARKAGLLWLLCTLITLLPAVAVNGVDRGLVYCPLQKAWVKSGGEPARQAPEMLKSVCASDTTKHRFTYERVRRMGARTTPGSESTEKLFFDYSRAGRKAFNALPPAPLPTQPGLSETSAPETGIANGRAAIDGSSAGIAVLPETSLSRTPYKPVTFQDDSFFVSDTIFRISTPRAPPISSLAG